MPWCRLQACAKRTSLTKICYGSFYPLFFGYFYAGDNISGAIPAVFPYLNIWNG